MRIGLGTGLIWGLPSWGKENFLSGANPEVEVDEETLSLQERQALVMSLKMGQIINLDDPRSIELSRKRQEMLDKRPGKSFIGDVGVDPRWAKLGEVEEEKTNRISVAELLKNFETWAKDEGKVRNQETLEEYLETLNGT